MQMTSWVVDVGGLELVAVISGNVLPGGQINDGYVGTGNHFVSEIYGY